MTVAINTPSITNAVAVPERGKVVTRRGGQGRLQSSWDTLFQERTAPVLQTPLWAPPGSHMRAERLVRVTLTWIVLPIYTSHPASKKSQIIKRKENLNGTELWKITFISCDHLKTLGRETLSHCRAYYRVIILINDLYDLCFKTWAATSYWPGCCLA